MDSRKSAINAKCQQIEDLIPKLEKLSEPSLEKFNQLLDIL
jgi:hypothetical protein